MIKNLYDKKSLSGIMPWQRFFVEVNAKIYYNII